MYEYSVSARSACLMRVSNVHRSDAFTTTFGLSRHKQIRFTYYVITPNELTTQSAEFIHTQLLNRLVRGYINQII